MKSIRFVMGGVLAVFSLSAFGQSLADFATELHINNMHSYYVSGEFTQGIARGEEHPRDLVLKYQSFESSILEGRVQMSAIMSEMSKTLDQLLTSCGQTQMYSICETNSCRRQARRQLQNCSVDSNQLQTINEQMTSIENMYAELHSDRVELALTLKRGDVTVRASAIEMQAATVLYSQNFLWVAVKPYDPEDRLTPDQERELTLGGMKQEWKKVAQWLGCAGGPIRSEFQSFAGTPGFIDTVCKLSVAGMQNGSVTVDDFIATFEPGVDWDQYTDFYKN